MERSPAPAAGDARLQDEMARRARSHLEVLTRTRKTVAPRLRALERSLGATYRRLTRRGRAAREPGVAAEWLLDNEHVVWEAVDQVRKSLPRGYYRQLPCLESGRWPLRPRVYALARAVLESAGTPIDLEAAVPLLDAYQRVAPLSIGELWAFPALLRLAVLEDLAATAATVSVEEGVEGATRGDERPGPLVGWGILALREIATRDWKRFVERTSRVEQILRRDPAGAYPRMSFETRDRYRQAVETMARRSPVADEVAVTRAAIELADPGDRGSREGSAAERAAHVGTYLVAEGRARLETAVGCRIPWWIRLGRRLAGRATGVYLVTVALWWAVALGAAGLWLATRRVTPWELVLGIFVVSGPALGLAISWVNWLVTLVFPPRVLPRMDPENRIPEEARTLVVMPVIVSRRDEIETLLSRLEVHFLGNRDPRLSFALLTDFVDATEKEMPADTALLAAAREGIARLNRRYGGGGTRPFHLFHRERRWNPVEGTWMGWERKRGKLEELNHLLGGSRETGFTVRVDPPEDLEAVRYVLTLDADTRLPPGAARELIATFVHPLNRPVIEAGSGDLLAGYTVLQPRVAVEPSAANKTRYARVFAGEAGLDLYTRAVSDVYQDLFGEAVFTGKGMYDVRAFRQCLQGRVPENRLLSHDLFEGVHGRVGLVSETVLFEDYPSNELLYARRLHRWIRGDWQLLPWLLPRVPTAGKDRIPSDLSLLDRWKIFDNLRRSLFLPWVAGLFLLAWLVLPGSAAALATLAVAAALGAPIVLGALGEIRRGVAGRAWRPAVESAAHGIRQQTAEWTLSLVFLGHLSYVVLDAVVRTLHRLVLSRRRLLEWTTAAHAARQTGGRLSAATAWRRMWPAPILAIFAAGVVAFVAPTSLPAAAPLLVLWLVSPQIAAWTSRPATGRHEVLTDAGRRELRMIARRTWRFFEELVGPADHWLPPDHLQVHPGSMVAHRTSPTNIAMLLLSTLAAYDLGFLGIRELATRVRQTLGTLDDLARHRGHWLNWYDTQSLEPLEPRYVSTVDSGNLAAALLVLGRGLERVHRRSVPNPLRLRGLADTVAVLERMADECLVLGVGGEDRRRGSAVVTGLASLEASILEGADRSAAEQWVILGAARDRLAGEIERMAEALESRRAAPDSRSVAELRAWAEHALLEARSAVGEIGLTLPWLNLLARLPKLYREAPRSSPLASAVERLTDVLRLPASLSTLPERAGRIHRRIFTLERALDLGDAPEMDATEARRWNRELVSAVDDGAARSNELLTELQELAGRALRAVEKTDFSFVYDPVRDLFRIGFHVSTGERDPNHYDLLASEARLASFLAIAKREAPLEHWLRLGRPVIRQRGSRVLLSWGATMFEYLMPTLVLKSPPRTLLEESCRVAVARQIAFARRNGIPWGISESGFAELGILGDYQYRAFGVPGLGLKRDLGDRLVVAPYASLLALPVRPRSVLENVDRLVALGLLGPYGLFEAVDFGLAEGHRMRRPRIVRSYMAHHQGMILVAAANHLLGDPMVERMHTDPRVASHELLLFEQIPRGQPARVRWGPSEAAAAEPGEPEPEAAPASARWEVPAASSSVVSLSNGVYTVLASSGGGGVSRWGDTALTRYRHDATTEEWGTWIYLEDLDSGKLWCPSLEPTGGDPAECRAVFSPDRAEYRRRHDGLLARCTVAVAELDHVELRRVLVVNESDRPRRLFVTSFAEVALGPQGEDRRHPAFAKLFVESEYRPEVRALLFRRRPRSPEQPTVVMGHSVLLGRSPQPPLFWETDRARFLGRGRDRRSPLALDDPPGSFTGTTGATLDPILSLGFVLELAPRSGVVATFLTAAGSSEDTVLGSLADFSSPRRIDWAFDRARSRSDAELRELEIPATEVPELAGVLSALLAPREGLRAGLEVAGPIQPVLWSHGISGDLPILVVRVSDAEDLGLVRELLRGHAWWRSHRLGIDLVILDEISRGYERPLRDRLQRTAEEIGRRGQARGPGRAIVLTGDELGATRSELLAAARVVLETGAGSLGEQLRRGEVRRAALPEFVPIRGPLPPPAEVAPVQRSRPLILDNGLGGFLEASAGDADGAVYSIFLEPGRRPPSPWVNVIANPELGFQVSESGASCTWAANSGEARLTPWPNDPVSDPSGETLYLRDEETAEIWSPTPAPAPADAPYEVRHAPGRTVFLHRGHGLEQQLELFVDPEAPVKLAVLRLRDLWHRPRRITATYCAEWVLGTDRQRTAPFLVPEVEPDTGALLARTLVGALAGKGVAFLASSRTPHGFTGDRGEWLGPDRDRSRPAGLRRMGLSGSVRPGLDPCAVHQIHVDLTPGESTEVHFLLGMGGSREEALELVRRFREPEQARASAARVDRVWEGRLARMVVETPDPAIDRMLNRWLPYQAVACRLWARSAFYQSSGAYGFRDQLQDAVNLAPIAPDLAREQILRSAAHQLEEGDVLHWWHPDSGFGVRTRCSDDLLWLPWACARYLEVTGDGSILDERAPYLSAPELGPDEVERFGSFAAGGTDGTVYEHCVRALDRAGVLGPHGLPRIGSGDWNDGMNRLGIEGRGESVWLGWFLCAVLRDFARVCERVGEPERATGLRDRARGLAEALEESAWDGAWYRRAYSDQGRPVGSAESEECQIDLIAQAWAVLSAAGDPQRAATAMGSVREHLLRRDDGLLLLLTPPFDHSDPDPGYVRAYPPGVRENGGQYTHAAVWGAWAFAELGDGDLAVELLRMLLPTSKTDTPEGVERYRVEPYVVAADVYGTDPHTGRGGWTWYTGSAAWLWRFGVEGVLGLRRRSDGLEVDPCIAGDWPGFRAEIREGETVYEIRVENPDGVCRGVDRIELDGQRLEPPRIPLRDDHRRHEVVVRMGR